ncbi:MAG: nitroreductase family protein [Deltaproteobacteria bacterium]|nr:nitroreductase family protein [Deltaproteobacteria bacterium]
MARVAAHPIEAMFLERWSPRAMNGEPLTEGQLQQVFEAARWAPSSGNSQPWRFLYAVQGTPGFEGLFGLLADGNKVWCRRAGALVLVLATTRDARGNALPTSAFDTGAAWMALALQARALGLVAHGMAGFDAPRARAELQVPEEAQVLCMVALGHPGDPAQLPEKLRDREVPNDRQAVETFIAQGAFPEGWKR